MYRPFVTTGVALTLPHEAASVRLVVLCSVQLGGRLVGQETTAMFPNRTMESAVSIVATVNWKELVAEPEPGPVPSRTTTRIVAVPNWPATGVRFSVRLLPLPVATMLV